MRRRYGQNVTYRSPHLDLADFVTKVHFDNPKWEPFLQVAVAKVCFGLGVDLKASKPRCELYKLLLYETGSQ